MSLALLQGQGITGIALVNVTVKKAPKLLRSLIVLRVNKMIYKIDGFHMCVALQVYWNYQQPFNAIELLNIYTCFYS
jgi:hypothetical protein